MKSETTVQIKKGKFFCVFSINEREKTKPKKRNLVVVFDFRKKQLKQERKRPNKKPKKIFLVFLL